MPELPEVEVVRRGLELLLPGRAITGVRSSGKLLRRPVPLAAMLSELPGKTIATICRRAKYLLLELSDGNLLVIHLGMTGKLGIFARGRAQLLHDHVIWELDDGRELRFNDVRRFGSIILLSAEQSSNLEETFFKTTGPEPLEPSFCADYLLDKAAGRSKPVKNFIMDNMVVAGVGNIYANESLFAAGISPTRPVGAISRNEWLRLVQQVQEVLKRAIACGGSTISDFIGADGTSGYFQLTFNVYGRKGKPCRRCSTAIEAMKLAGRASFYCPTCQR